MSKVIACTKLRVTMVDLTATLCLLVYEGESISNQPIQFPIDRNGHDFHVFVSIHVLYVGTNCTLIEPFFNQILNVKHG